MSPHKTKTNALGISASAMRRDSEMPASFQLFQSVNQLTVALICSSHNHPSGAELGNHRSRLFSRELSCSV
jgi:hypothetical protein